MVQITTAELVPWVLASGLAVTLVISKKQTPKNSPPSAKKPAPKELQQGGDLSEYRDGYEEMEGTPPDTGAKVDEKELGL